MPDKDGAIHVQRIEQTEQVTRRIPRGVVFPVVDGGAVQSRVPRNAAMRRSQRFKLPPPDARVEQRPVAEDGGGAVIQGLGTAPGIREVDPLSINVGDAHRDLPSQFRSSPTGGGDLQLEIAGTIVTRGGEKRRGCDPYGRVSAPRRCAVWRRG